MQESTETRFPTATTSPSPLLKGSQLSPQLRLVNPPCLIVYREMRFLLMDAPSELTVPLYIKEMHRHNVTDLVRVCEPTYSRPTVEASGIRMHVRAFIFNPRLGLDLSRWCCAARGYRSPMACLVETHLFLARSRLFRRV